jgi:hypothetical protein
MTGPRLAALACALVTLCLAAPATASASFTVTPSTLQAGAPAKVAIHADFASSPTAVTLHLPAGLVGNPGPFAQCTEAQFQSDACPAGSRVGDASANGGVASGGVFNLVPHPDEPARLGITVAALLVLPARNEASVSLRPDGGLDSTISELKSVAGLSITSLDLTLRETFMTMPTSCGPAKTTIEAPPNAPQSATFTPTGCAGLPFAPQFAASLDARGPAGARYQPEFRTVITVPAGHAATSSAHVALPERFTLQPAAIKAVCTLEQQAADACPAAARVGSVTAHTPLLPVPLSGPVYLATIEGELLPGLRLALDGPAKLRLNGRLVLGIPLTAVFDGIPDVPLSRLELTFAGGGPVKVLGDPCTGALLRATGVLTGHNGGHATSPALVTLSGCPLTGSARVKRGALRLDLRKGRDRQPLTLVRLTLPRGVRIARRGGVVARADGKPLARDRVRLAGRRIELRVPDAARVALRLPLRGRRAGRVTVDATRTGGEAARLRLRLVRTR